MGGFSYSPIYWLIVPLFILHDTHIEWQAGGPNSAISTFSGPKSYDFRPLNRHNFVNFLPNLKFHHSKYSARRGEHFEPKKMQIRPIVCILLAKNVKSIKKIDEKPDFAKNRPPHTYIFVDIFSKYGHLPNFSRRSRWSPFINGPEKKQKKFFFWKIHRFWLFLAIFCHLGGPKTGKKIFGHQPPHFAPI